MDRITKYSGISAITVSLFMLTLGSMPTSFAGQVDSQLQVNISCGLQVTNPNINWNSAIDPTVPTTLDSTNAGDFSGTQPTVTNPSGNTATSNVGANVGDNNSGGYAGDTDNTTHIEPTSISVDLVTDTPPASPVAMNNAGTNTAIGSLAPGDVDTLQLVVDTTTIVGLPTTDTLWTATINLAANCVLS